MPPSILRCKSRKLPASLLALSIFLGSYMIIHSLNTYFESIKQPNVYLRQSLLRENTSSVQRAILIFYPSNQEKHYLPEVLWLYRSWLEMMKNESQAWRTDLNIYTEQHSPALQQLGCVLNQVRSNASEPPRCRVFLYLRILNRTISGITKRQTLYTDNALPSLFEIDVSRAAQLYLQLSKYGYIDSVNIIAEAYPTFQCYDFILKTDIDVFVTRQFARYTPATKNAFLVGLGGYSTDFNTRRLGRVARDMGWHYQNLTNIGSTWYGSPYIAQRIANLTLDAMLYLYANEFSRGERKQKVGTLLWPDWHYGVLSMYGTHMAVNHLLLAEEIEIKKADQLLDQSTTNKDPYDLEKSNRLHLHCWHTERRFSKFQFKAGTYNQIHPRSLLNDSSAQAYALRMALESRLMTLAELGQRLETIGARKVLQ